MNDVVVKIGLIAVLYLFYYIIKYSLKPLSPRPNATLLRKLMRDRMRKRREAPHLCDRHSNTLKPGQMAVLDTKNCELCTNQTKKVS